MKILPGLTKEEMMAVSVAELKTSYQYGFRDPERPVFKARKGLSHEVVEQIAHHKGEAEWMRAFRHEALDIFLSKPMPNWGGVDYLQELDFDDTYFYLKPVEEKGRTWDAVPEEIKRTFDRLGIPKLNAQCLPVLEHSMKAK